MAKAIKTVGQLREILKDCPDEATLSFGDDWHRFTFSGYAITEKRAFLYSEQLEDYITEYSME